MTQHNEGQHHARSTANTWAGCVIIRPELNAFSDRCCAHESWGRSETQTDCRMRQEVSQPQSRFSALTSEQMAVCGNNKPDQRERASQRTLHILHYSSSSHADRLFMLSREKWKKRKFTRTFFRCCFLSSCSTRQVERYHSPDLPVSICVSVTSEWPLSDLCVTFVDLWVTSVDLCWPGELQIIGVNSVTSQNNSAVFCIVQWELSLLTATETWAEISCVYFNVNIQTDELYNRGQHIVFDACNYIVIVSWPDIFKLCFLCFWWLMVLCQCCLSPW